MAVYEEYLNYRLTGRCSNPFWQRKFGGVSGGGGGTGGGSEPAELLSWEGVAYHIEQGDYKDVYKIGDAVPLDLGSEGIINMQIAAFDADTLADGSGTAAISWVAKELLTTCVYMNPALESETDESGNTVYHEGTGTIGGWGMCEGRAYLNENIKPLVPPYVKNQIVSVSETLFVHGTTGTFETRYEQTTQDEIFIPSYYSISGIYSGLFQDQASRVRCVAGTEAAKTWWCKDYYTTKVFRYVETNGSWGKNVSDAQRYVLICFCTGKTPT